MEALFTGVPYINILFCSSTLVNKNAPAGDGFLPACIFGGGVV
jgi:hypothetical protein